MTAGTRATADAGATAEFERVYRANVEAVTAYFARRSADPHVVADLTADTFVAVITSFGSFDPRKGTARAWVFGIARRVYASYCEACSQQQHKMRRLAGRRDLDQDQVEELLDRIDAERAGRDLVSGLAALPEQDRAVVELVDLAGLQPREAATADRLRQLGDDVVVVPVQPGCPSISSLPAPAVLPGSKGSIRVQGTKSRDGSITVNAEGVPAGDILVVAAEVTAQGTQMAASLTSPPAPSCVSLPAQPSESGPSVAHQTGSGPKVHRAGSGSNVSRKK